MVTKQTTLITDIEFYRYYQLSKFHSRTDYEGPDGE